MKLKIIDINFTTSPQWIYKLIDQEGDYFYIMDDPFYKRYDLKSPLTKKELDSFDRDMWINATAIAIQNINVVISIS